MLKIPLKCIWKIFLRIMAINTFSALCIAKPVMTTDLLQSLRKGEPWDRGVLTATKTVMFQQSASSGTDATSISKITLAYFTSSDCTGSTAGSGFYTTPDGTSFAISVGTSFGLVAASAWNVGSTQLSIADMTTIQSIAVTFKSTNNNTPQAAFTNASAQVISYACVPVTCTAGECTSGSGTQSFTLKTTAAVGDPADGGVIGCQNTGSSFNLYNLVVTTSDQPQKEWGGQGITITAATSTTNGAANTAAIVACLTGPGGGAGCPQSISADNYAAGVCGTYSSDGGFTSGWFLPSSGTGVNTQLNCLYNNRAAIAVGSLAAGGAGFLNSIYWSSTQANASNAWELNFATGTRQNFSKGDIFNVRCTRAF